MQGAARLRGSHRHESKTGYSPTYVDRIWGIWGSCYNMPKAIFYRGTRTILTTEFDVFVNVAPRNPPDITLAPQCQILKPSDAHNMQLYSPIESPLTGNMGTKLASGG